MDGTSLIAILPEIILTVFACLVFVLDPFVPRENKEEIGLFCLMGIFLAALSFPLLIDKEISAFSGMIMLDPYALFFKGVFLGVCALTIFSSVRYLQVEGIYRGEYYGLILFATVGMMLMPASTDMLSLYLSLELMSMSFYVLTAFMRKDPRSIEAGVKYFLTGVLTSGLFLYGVALLYGATGTTHLGTMKAYLAGQGITSSPALTMGIVLIIAGFGFKIAAVPFHMWAPDVYEGAPTTVTAYLSTGSKVAAFAAMPAVFMTGLDFGQPIWTDLLWVVAALTMTLGNVAALMQTNIKRMLAYSSVAQSGYLLIGLVTASGTGIAAMVIYSLAYALMTLGAFTIVILMCSEKSRGEQITDFKGLAKTHPGVAAAFVLFALSLVGIPPTAGFVGKLFLFNAAIQGSFYWLAVIAILNSATSLYYYFKVVMMMYMQEPEGPFSLSSSSALTIALVVTSLGTLLIGLYPEPLIRVAVESVKVFL